jgi:hypothetical protein
MELDRAGSEFLTEHGFPDDFENEIIAVVDAAHETMADPYFTDDPEQLHESAKTLSLVSAALDRVSTLSGILSLDTYGKSKALEKGASVFEERAIECEPPEPDDYEEREHRTSSPEEIFDVDALFAELYQAVG